MIIENVFDSIALVAKTFLPPNPSEELTQKLLDTLGAKDVDEKINITLSLGGVVFDLIRQSVQLGVFPLPASPKLQYAQEKEFSDFVQKADTKGEIEIPDSWLKYLDQILSDDEIFCKTMVYGEITKPVGEYLREVPFQGRVINTLPVICPALLKILPQ